MGIERKEIIIKEIKYWKQSKLLPENYCDFLLMLYTQGEGEVETNGNNKRWEQMWFYLNITFLLLLLPVSSYFLLSDLSLVFKLLLSFAIILIASYYVFYFKKKASIAIHIPIIILFSTFLTGSIAIVPHTVLNVYGIIIFHCILWCLIGAWQRLYYLLVSGGIGFLIIMVNYFVI